MKISRINLLQEGQIFFYKGEESIVTWKRERDDNLALGTEEFDKSVCLSFQNCKTSEKITLVSRLDSKMVEEGRLYELDLKDYEASVVIFHTEA